MEGLGVAIFFSIVAVTIPMNIYINWNKPNCKVRIDLLEEVKFDTEKDILARLVNGENATEYFCNAAIVTNYLVTAASSCFERRDKSKGALYVRFGIQNPYPSNQRKIIKRIDEETTDGLNAFHLVLLVMEEPTGLDRKIYLQTWPLSLDIHSEEKPEIYGYSETNLCTETRFVAHDNPDYHSEYYYWYKIIGEAPEFEDSDFSDEGDRYSYNESNDDSHNESNDDSHTERNEDSHSESDEDCHSESDEDCHSKSNDDSHNESDDDCHSENNASSDSESNEDCHNENDASPDNESDTKCNCKSEDDECSDDEDDRSSNSAVIGHSYFERPELISDYHFEGGAVMSEFKLIAVCGEVCTSFRTKCRKFYPFLQSMKKIMNMKVPPRDTNDMP